MTTKELLRAEIERRKGYISVTHFAEDLLSFLDTLPDESAQPTRGYDEAYLNEKIVKASKSWEGVDVDKFMDEIRGREPVTDCHELTEAAEKSWVDYEYREDPRGLYSSCYVDGFTAGAEWQKRKMIEGATYNELMELYRAIRDELVKRHCDVPVNIKEEQ